MGLSDRIEDFFDEWVNTRAALRERDGWKNHTFLVDIIPLNHGGNRGSEFINKRGNDILYDASTELLKQTRLTGRFTAKTARAVIIKSFFDYLLEARTNNEFDGRRVEKMARSRILQVEPDDGVYVFPVFFAPKAVSSAFVAGPVEILSGANFRERYPHAFRATEDQHESDLIEKWKQYSVGYDHFILVHMAGFEAEIAWENAREAAEYILNLIRILFGFGATSAIKLAGGYMREMRRSTIRFDDVGRVWPTRHNGPWGSHLDDSWQDHFERQFSGYRNVLGSFALKLTKGNDLISPVVERLRYAHSLIAEAYSEPHDPQRLVRFVSALETLALAPEQDKAHVVSKNSACAGGWGNAAAAAEIYDAVRNAYRWRSAVVHGDAPTARDVGAAFLGVEVHAFTIVIGYMVLFAALFRRRHQSIRSLRRDFARRIDHFFWNADVALLQY